jgi:hydrogenase nickel incorporation protein HypB
LDILIVENIGNLGCSAEFDIGEHLKIALISIPEGDDKVEKYPPKFTRADDIQQILEFIEANIKR